METKSDIDLDAIEWGPRIEWSGGECPVSGPVKVWYEDSSDMSEDPTDFRWLDHGVADIIAYAVPAVPAVPEQDDKVRDLMHAVVSLCDVAEVSPVALRDALADLYPLPEPAEQPPKWGRELVSAGDGRRPVPEDEMLRFRDWAGSGMAEESMAYTADWDKPRTFQRLASTPDYNLGVEEVYGPGVRLDMDEQIRCGALGGPALLVFLSENQELRAYCPAMRVLHGIPFRRVLRYADEVG